MFYNPTSIYCELSIAERNRSFLLFCISLVSILVSMRIPNLQLLFILPLVIMIFRPNPMNFLSVLILCLNGSVQICIAGACCFLYVLVHIDRILQKGLGVVFLIYLAGLPFFVWYTFQRMGVHVTTLDGPVGAFQGIGGYFSLAPFFWAAISIPRLPRQFFSQFMILCAVCFGISMTSGLSVMSGNDAEDGLKMFRFGVYALSYIPAWIIVMMLAKKFRINPRNILLLAGAFFVVGVLYVTGRMLMTFTELGVMFVTVGYVWCGRKYRRFLVLFCPALIFAILCAFAWTSAERYERNADKLNLAIREYSEFKVDSFTAMMTKLQTKAIGDRARLWAANVNLVKQIWETKPVFVDPFPDVATAEFWVNGQMDYFASVLPAHNLMLQTLKTWGFYGGGVVLLVFVMILSNRKFNRILTSKDALPYSLFVASCFAHCLVGGFAGHYPLQLQMSFPLWGTLGVCYCFAISNPLVSSSGRVTSYYEGRC